MIRKGIAAIAATALALATGSAQAANAPCLTPGEADALFTVIAPDAIRAIAKSCASALPAPGLLGGRAEAMASRFDARAAAAMPQMPPLFARLTGSSTPPDPALLRPLLETVVDSMITSHIKPQNCGAINLGLKLAEPMPAEQVSHLVVLLASIVGNQEKDMPFRICPGPVAPGSTPPEK